MASTPRDPVLLTDPARPVLARPAADVPAADVAAPGAPAADVPSGDLPAAGVLTALAGAAGAAGDAADPVAAALQLARAASGTPLPGAGATARRWEVLATASAADLTAGRVLEAHLDALAVLAEAGLSAPEDSTWGVFAAEAAGLRVDAVPAPPAGSTPPVTASAAAATDAPAWTLTGTKPWCSLAGSLSHALVTAHTPTGRRLFRVELTGPGVRVRAASGWVSRGLAAVTSTPVDLDGVPAEPVGADGWYLHRDGFAWGGLGVAACWYGGAVGVGRRMLVAATDPAREPDQVALVHLGAVEVALAAARACLTEAAALVDAGLAAGADGAALALRVRAVVADAVEEVLLRAGRSMGPAPLTGEEDHARRVADLQVYVRQHHAERDLAALGRHLLETSPDAPDHRSAP